MSDAFAIVSAPTGANARPDAARRRDPHARDSTQPSFATFLDAALDPAARPLTRPAAAGTEGAASAEQATDDGANAAAASANGTPGGEAVTAAGAAGTNVESGGGPGDAATVAPPTLDVASPADAAARAAAAHGIYRGTDALAPELRERLGRVIERMKAEHGHDVRVTETFRSQARQDQLHAQGRTVGGPIVTWTRSSNHTQGRAVDVMVNGTYGDPAAYATLQRIAGEEGLHTLGMRDPGHLELPKAVGGRIDIAELARLSETPGLESLRIDDVHVGGDDALAAPAGRAARAGDAAGPAAVARVATVAPVAQVAQVAAVAQVATVAQVAAPGARRASPVARANAATGGATTTRAESVEAMLQTGGGPAARRAAPFAGGIASNATSTLAGANSAAVAAGDARTAHAATARDGRGAGTRAERETAGREEPVDASTGTGDSSYATASHTRGDGLGVAGAERAAGAERVESLDHLARLDRIAALRDSAAQRPLSHLTLTLDNAAGGADRIRVGLRGASVGATLELSDAAQAERLTSRLGELQQALEARGLEADGLHVRRAGVSTEPGEVARIATVALEREALRAGASSSSTQSQSQQHSQSQSHATPQRERDERSARDESQRDPSSSRHRSRREHEEHTR